MTQLCHPGGMCCAEVAGTEHGASHSHIYNERR